MNTAVNSMGGSGSTVVLEVTVTDKKESLYRFCQIGGGCRPFDPTLLRQCIRRISVGDRASIRRKITAQDVRTFALLSGDANPVHLDEDYAKKTKYGRCIAHGALIHGLASCLFGVHFPGTGCLYHSMDSVFPGPLFVGENCQLDAEVERIKGILVTFVVRAFAVERQACVMEGHINVVVTRAQLAVRPPTDVIDG
ncbi:unnamed protein product [Calicophoron daubneyi]|uniref:MaoC-like domain-containing protein n=1 Tax=Calicophoron daubneyi TaxID=300641 RepID=A0AAV2TGE6_CALDB